MKKISDHLFIKILNKLVSVLFYFVCVLLIFFIPFNLFFYGNNNKISASKITVSPFSPAKISSNANLDNWFNNKVVVREGSSVVTVYVNLDKKERFLPLSIGFQLIKYLPLFYVLFVLFFLKKIINSIMMNNVFTRRNYYNLLFMGGLFFIIPLIEYVIRNLFLSYINKTFINDSGFVFENNLVLQGQWFLAVMFFLFALVFKAAVDVKTDNDLII